MAPVVGGLPTGPDNQAVTEAYELAKEEEEKREEELASPAAAKEREDSLRAYADLTPAQAEELLVIFFPEFLASLNSDPARSLSDSRLDRNLGEGDAVVTTEGKTQLMEGSFPVETPNDEGDLEKVDVSLEETIEGYEAENPLVEVAIADSAEEGVVVGGNGSVGQMPSITITQVGAEESAARPLGDKNVFYGEVEPGKDTDLFVAPTTYGVELANLLRTVDSPETLRFHVDLPVGAQLRADQGGGAEILAADGELLYRVNRPISFDAQGSTVPTTLEIEGDNLVVRVPHREADIAYPILVDPELQMDWNHPSFPGIAPYGPWYPSESWAGNGMYVGTSDGYWPGLQGLYFHAHNAGIAAGAWDQLSYYPPNEQSYIARAYLHQFWRGDSCSPLVQDPYDYTGMYAWNNGGTPETPHWNGYRNNDAYWQGWSNINSWGNALVIGYGNASTKTNACWRRVRVGLMTIWLEDWQYPSLNSVGATPSGWLKKDATPRTFSVSASDAGLGVRTVRMFGVGTQEWQWDKGWCAGTYANPCNTSGSGQITFTTNGFPYEGRYNGEGKERKFTVQVKDPTEKSYKLEYPIWLDGTAPTVKLNGQLASITKQVGEAEKPQNEEGDHDELSLPTYKLEITADDLADRSGVKEIKVFLDKDPSKEPGVLPTATKPAGSCPTAGCAQTLAMDYTLRLPDLDAGKHSLWIVAVDKVGNESDLKRNIEFEYIPATGMKDEYVMQHFRLPDGNDYSGEAEYHGPEIAVNVINGNVVYHQRDVEVDTDRAGLELERVYNSQQPVKEDTQWGRGWDIAQAPVFEPEPEQGTPSTATMVRGGAITNSVPVPQTAGQESFSPRLRATVTKTAGGFEVDPATEDGIASFDQSGRIEQVMLGDDTPVFLGPEEFELPSSESPEFLASFGSSGTGAGQFSAPSDIAVAPSDDLYVVDSGNDRIQKFDASGTFVAQFGSSGSANGQLDQPGEIAVGSAGSVYVADSGNNRVQKFVGASYNAKFGSLGSGNGQLKHPEGLTIDDDGDVWVADTGNGRLQEFNAKGEFLRIVGSSGSGPGQLGEPVSIDAAPNGEVYVADFENNRVAVFGEDGSFLRQFGSTGAGNGQLQGPTAIEVDAAGSVWVADQGNSRVQRFDDEGNYFSQFGSKGAGAGQFDQVGGIAADDDGQLWVIDSDRPRAQPPTNESPAPVAAYSFNAGTGTLAEDAFGSHDATIEDATWTTGKFGKALAFDGQDSCVSTPNSVDLQLTEAFTLEAWVNPHSYGGHGPIFFKEIEEGTESYSLWVGAGNAGRLEGFVAEEGWEWAEVSTSEMLPAQTWTHIAMTSDGSTLRLYLNGNLIDSTGVSGALESEGPLTIGCAEFYNDYFEGKIDEARIYDRTLTQEEIEGDMDTPVEIPSQEPVAAYSFNAGTGTLAEDAFGSHDATIEDATWTTGKFGKALAFDGQDSCASTPNSVDLQLTEAFTLEAWVNPANSTQWAPIFFKEAEGFYSYSLFFGAFNAGHLQGYVADAPWEGTEVESPGTLAANTWSHVAMTSDRTNLRLYVNGNLVDTASAEDAMESDKPLWIGCSGLWDEKFEGKIDEARIYDRALNAGELAADMTTEVGAPHVNRVQAWKASNFVVELPGGPAPYFDPPVLDYEYENGKLEAMQLEDEATEGADPELDLVLSSAKVIEVESEEAGDTTYSYEGARMSAADSPAGETKYTSDASGRLTSVTLPNGTTATITYDETSRATSVKVDPAGPEAAKTTNFSYKAEPRQTKVWGGGVAETTYEIGDDGSVVKWAWAETPPTIASMEGSLVSKKEQELDKDKDQTLFVTGSSPHQVASIRVVVNGNSVVEEKTCQDPASPPSHVCDQPERLEWITHPSEHAAGRMDIEVVVEDFLGHQTAQRFFVIVPQQDPSDPALAERPNFKAIKSFRDNHGLDRNNPRTDSQMNELVLELLYEWEGRDPTAMAAVENFGSPMRAPELAEMEYRRQYVNNAADVISEWAEEHAAGLYGGSYVDDRAGGLVYVGFTQNQAALVEALKGDPRLINPGAIREFPTPPTISIAGLETSSDSVIAALDGNATMALLTTSVHVSSQSQMIEVGATDPATVQQFLISAFGAGAPIKVRQEAKYQNSASRYGTSGPIVGGAGLFNAGICTAGYGSRAQTGVSKGQPLYTYFTTSAGHCFDVGDVVHREEHKFASGPAIGTVRRDGAPAGQRHVTDALAIKIADNLRSHSVLNGVPLEAQPIQGVQRVKENREVCWSGIFIGRECGPVRFATTGFIDHEVKRVFIVEGWSMKGDSGGPVWDPITHKAVGIISFGLPAVEVSCYITSFKAKACPGTAITPLLQGGGSNGANPVLGIETLRQG